MTVLVNESFAGVDSDPIGGNWTTVTGFGAIQRISNQAHGRATTHCVAEYNAGSAPPDDQYCSVTIGTLASAGGPCVRVDQAAADYYVVFAQFAFLAIYKVIGGSFSLLVSESASPSDGDVVTLSAVGTQLTASLNGAQVATVADGDIASGRFGIDIYDSTFSLNSIEAGDFATGTLASINGLAAGSIASVNSVAVADLLSFNGLTF